MSIKRDLSILFFSFLMILGNAPVWAANSNARVINEVDAIQLDNGMVITGEISKFGSNSFTIATLDGDVKVANNRVNVVVVGQDMTDIEKYRLGKLDGKRYAKNKGGNFAVGFFFGLIGAGVVYLTADQMPSYEAAMGPNKAIVNDANYMRGYEKGAQAKSGGNALLGTAVWVGLIILAAVGTTSYYYY